jgi:hypothetical protein
MNKQSRLNAVLIAACAFMAMLLVVKTDSSAVLSRADASVIDPQPDSKDPPFNAAEQRRQMIAMLTETNRRLAALETKINAGLSVKVTEMPAVTIKPDPAKKD